jgi:hypothetical protein
VEVVQSGNLFFLSGMLLVAGGKPAYLGRLGAELTVEDGRKAAAIACLNVRSATRHHCGAMNTRARRLLNWQPLYPSWRAGFSQAI